MSSRRARCAPAVPRSRCRWCRRACARATAARRSSARAPAGTIAPPTSGRSSWLIVMCVPRLGRMRGSSASSCSSLRAQLVGPHAGRVDDVRRAHVEASPLSQSSALHAVRAPVALEQPGHVEAIGAHRAEALGLAEHGQHEAHVVGLAVVEQVAAGRLARGERGQQLEHLLAGDHAVALRAPGLAALGRLGVGAGSAGRLALGGARAPPGASAADRRRPDRTDITS